jgi:hypothetical protein
MGSHNRKIDSVSEDKKKIALDTSDICDGDIDSRLTALECMGYQEGCCCKKCIRKWSHKEPWKRRPRCILCPSMCNKAGLECDGVCGDNCKIVLCELMTGKVFKDQYSRGHTTKECGYPFGVFKQTRWAELRRDAV